jgi:hypothetical protein
MIKATYIDDWRLISKLSAEWPFTQEEIYLALEQEEFIGEERAYCTIPKSIILQQLLNKMEEAIPKLLTELCEQEQFKKDLWHLESTEQMTNNVRTTCSFARDTPGFDTNIHLDSRMTVCTGMLFFNQDNDPLQSTCFYTTLTGNEPVCMSSQFGNGWFAANTSISWHTGGNASSRYRYSLIFNVYLNLL